MKTLPREDVAPLRVSLSRLGVVVAEIDRELRYVWIENPHPDFDPAKVIGKSDDELIPPDQAAEIMALKRAALTSTEPVTRILRFNRSDRVHYYSISAYPIVDVRGGVEGLFTVGFDSALKMPEHAESSVRQA